MTNRLFSLFRVIFPMKFVLIPAIYYLGGPLLVWRTHRQAAVPKLEPLGQSPPAEGFSYFSSMAKCLTAMGFELIGYFGLAGDAPRVSGATGYFVHRKNGDAAIVISVFAGGMPARKVLKFATRFSDQSSLTTGNSGNPGVYIRPKEKPVYHFPHIESPEKLYHLHQALMPKFKPGIPKDPVKAGAEYDRMVEGMQNEKKTQVRFGLLKLDASATHYRPTFIGAFRMTWSLVFPVKQIRQVLASFRAKRLEKILIIASPQLNQNFPV